MCSLQKCDDADQVVSLPLIHFDLPCPSIRAGFGDDSLRVAQFGFMHIKEAGVRAEVSAIQTCSVSPDEVRAALRLVLDRIGRPDVSASEAYSLANSLGPIIDADPSFAVDVYSATFAHEEKSQKKTQMGGSKVLVLTSTRAQDYWMAYYILGVRFHHFLERDLNCAALAAIRSVGAQVQREHVKTARKIGKYSARFTFANVKSRLVADGSQFWDQGYRDNVSLQILDAFLNEMSERLKSGGLTNETSWALFRMIAKENRFPVVWKRVMEHASRSPELLPFAVPLLQAPSFRQELIAELFDEES
jgi:hypothetical protein